MVRNVKLPGGAPGGGLRKTDTVVHEARCGKCSAEWRATYRVCGFRLTEPGEKATTH
jgi:hypothetical protein